MKIQAEAQVFKDFWKEVNDRRAIEGFSPLSRTEAMKSWDIIMAFTQAWAKPPSSVTPSAPRGGSGGGAGFGG